MAFCLYKTVNIATVNAQKLLESIYGLVSAYRNPDGSRSRPQVLNNCLPPPNCSLVHAHSRGITLPKTFYRICHFWAAAFFFELLYGVHVRLEGEEDRPGLRQPGEGLELHAHKGRRHVDGAVIGGEVICRVDVVA